MSNFAKFMCSLLNKSSMKATKTAESTYIQRANPLNPSPFCNKSVISLTFQLNNHRTND